MQVDHINSSWTCCANHDSRYTTLL